MPERRKIGDFLYIIDQKGSFTHSAGDVAHAVGIGAVRRTGNDHGIDLRDQLFDCKLTAVDGIAHSAVFLQGGETFFEFCGKKFDFQMIAGGLAEQYRSVHLRKIFYPVSGFYDEHFISSGVTGDTAHFRVFGIAENNQFHRLVKSRSFTVKCLYARTTGIYHCQIAFYGGVFFISADAVGSEHHHCAFGNLFKRTYKNCTFFPHIITDTVIVDQFIKHINGAGIFLMCLFKYLHCTAHSGTKSARRNQLYSFFALFFHVFYKIALAIDTLSYYNIVTLQKKSNSGECLRKRCTEKGVFPSPLRLTASDNNIGNSIYMPEFNELPGGSETILIVDDHETIWDFLIEALQDLGYSVLLAENGLDAVEIYTANPDAVDLVLLDMIMPKLNGHEAFYKIRELDPEAKILLSSGFVSEEEVQYLLKEGACGFLAKPHRLPVVIKAVRDVLDGKKVTC